jgi:hypothetical protein
MNHRELLLSLLTFGFEVVLCSIVFSKNVSRRLPFFAAYTYVLLLCTVGLAFTYEYFGFRSTGSYYAYWVTALLDMIARSLVIAELCHYGLHAYRGVWTLLWRALSILSLLFLVHAAWDAWGQPNRLAIYGLTLERDLGIASITILIVLLLTRNYYGLTLEIVPRAIAFGIFLYCAVDVIDNTIIRNLYTGTLFSWFSTSHAYFWEALKPQIERANDIWSTIHFSSFMISVGIWCFALRKPLPAMAPEPELLPVDYYREFSPAVNLRLRAFNDRLLEMLKP